MNKWYVSPMQALEFVNRTRIRPEEIVLFTKDISLQFFAEMASRDHVVVWVYGSTGTGKSTVSMELARIKDPSFTADLIIFDNAGLKSVTKTTKEGNSLVRDETVKDFGEGSNQMLATIQDLTETLRKRRNSFFLLSPVVKGLPFVHYYLEVLQSNVNLERDSLRDAIKKGLKLLRFRVGVWDRNNNPLGYIQVQSVINNKVYVDYEKKKDNFLALMASGERQSGLDINREAQAVLDEINLTEYPRKADRLNFIKSNSNFTLGQCKSIASEVERILINRGGLL